MPTAEERAKEQEARALARAGLNPDGTPMNPQGGRRANVADDNNDGDDDGDDGDDDPTGRLLGNEGEDEVVTLRQRLAKMEADLAAANNRAAPEQQRAAEMRDLWQASERERLAQEERFRKEREELQAALDARTPAFDVNTVLDETDRERFDEDTLRVITKIAEAMVKTHVPKIDARSETLKVLEEREREKVNNYRKAVLNDPTRGLHQLAQLSYDPAFQAWSNEEDNDMESVVTSLLNAQSTEAVDRFAKIVAKRIKTFKERNANPRPTDPKGSLEGSMRRAGKPRLSQAELEAKYAEVKRLSRGNAADRAMAQKILDELK